MSQLVSGSISFSGLGNGTDFDSMIEGLKSIEMIEVQRLESWKSDWQVRVDAFQEVIDGMQDLSTILDEIDSVNGFLSKGASVSPSGLLTAKTTSEAIDGTYTVDVAQLAQSAKLSSKTAYEKTEDISGGIDSVFTYEYAGEVQTVNVPKGTTLESFVNLINNDQTNPGVQASLIKSGDGYVFQLQGKETGAENSLKVVESTTLADDGSIVPSFALFPPTIDKPVDISGNAIDTRFIEALNPDLSTVDPSATYEITDGTTTIYVSGQTMIDVMENDWYSQDAQDALFTLNGFDEQVLTSSSNKLTDVIPGLEIDLHDTGKSTITVATDTEAVKENVEKFVEGFNALMTIFNDLTNVDPDKDVEDASSVTYDADGNLEMSFASSQFASQHGSALTGNYGAQLLESKIKTIGVGTAVGFTPIYEQGGYGDIFASLSSVGITIDADESSPTFGLLQITTDANKDPESPYKSIDEALAEDPEAVARLFAANNDPSTDSSDFSFSSQQSSITKAGDHEVTYSVVGGVPTNVMIGGAPASYDEVTKEYTAMSGDALGLAIKIDNLADGNYNGTMSLRQGKIVELNNILKDELKNDTSTDPPERGSMIVLKENYLDIMESIDLQIEEEERRIATWENRMQLQFARLDALLGTYDLMMQSNASALATAVDVGG